MFSGRRPRHILTWPSAREHLIEFCRRENFKTYIKGSSFSKYNDSLSLPLAFPTTDAHCSVQISCSIFLRYNSSTSVHRILGRPFFTPPPGLSSKNYFSVPVPILTTFARHSIKSTLITVSISAYINLLLCPRSFCIVQ